MKTEQAEPATRPMTPYRLHDALNHHMTRYSPNSVDIIEECTDCGARFLHNPDSEYPITLDSMPMAERTELQSTIDGLEDELTDARDELDELKAATD